MKKKCMFCKEEMDQKATTCPHCGKTQVSGLAFLVFIILFIGIVIYFYNVFGSLSLPDIFS